MNNIHDIIDKLSLEDITIFLEKGDLKHAPEGVPEYLNLLEKARGMILRFDLYPNDEIIVNYLVLQDNLTRAKARDIIAEAREFFYCQQKVSIEAWGNIYAEMMDKLIRLTMLTVKDVKDGLSVGKLIKDAWDIRGGNKTQEEQIPFEVLNRPIWTIYTSDITILGYPKANRNIIKDLINSTTLELSEKEKQIIHREADILPFKLFPNVEEGSRKS